MNRFWGRNEHGPAPRFSRDDEQILALNYENLCDGDYLNRLFSSDAVSAISEEATADASAGISGSVDNGLFSAELPEDFIVFGNDRILGRAFAKIRFNRQLVTSLKNQDAVTAIVNRQAVVFEHVSKLMIERCVPLATLSLAKPASQHNAESIQSLSLNHFASTALDCCLTLLEHENGRNLSLKTLEPVISLVFQINQEAVIKARFPQLVLYQPMFSVKHVGILRNVLSQSAMQCMTLDMGTNSHSYGSTRSPQQLMRMRSATEESFRTSLASFYGLLALGLHTRDASEILVAIAHLMTIILRAEEWAEDLKAESKLQLTQALSLAASAAVVVNSTGQSTQQSPANVQQTEKGLLASATSVPPKMPPKLKNAQNSTESTASKVPAVKGSTGRSTTSGSTAAAPPTAAGNNNNTVVTSPSLVSPISPTFGPTVTPSTALITLPVSLNHHNHSAHSRSSPSGRRVSEEHRAECSTEEEVTEFTAAGVSSVAPQPANNLQHVANATHNSSNPNMKASWEKPINTKLPADPVAVHPTLSSHAHAALSTKTKINSKMSKAEARVIQEILDPNMYTAQELSAYYASNPSAVNYVFSNNNSQTVINNNHNEEGLNTAPRKGTNHNNNHHSSNKNNNNQPAAEEMPHSASAAHNNTANISTSQTLILRHKKNVRAIKESLQDLLKTPKPTLKVLYDSCAESERKAHVTSAATTNMYGAHVSSVGNDLISPGAQFSSHPGGGSLCGSTYVWSCGQNSYGELGLGDSVMRKSFTRVSCLDNKIITSIGAGNEHSLFVTSEGKLYTSGYNDNGQCGTGTTAQVRTPSVVTALESEEVAQVHVYNGCEHTLATTRDGKIFSFGYNYRGQLGLGSTISEFTPRQIRGLMSRKVVQAACSYHHSFMLCSDGSLYSCGRNDSGQLGHGDFVDKKTPQCLNNAPANICSLSCGQFHSVCSTSSGVAYACGKNDYGQLGIENSPTVKVFTPIGVHSDVEFVSQVCCGYYHTLLLSNSGVVAGFGRNDYGQLGLGHAQQKVFVCTPIVPLRDKNVRTLAAGCYHSIIITANGMLYVFGRNNHGQLATGDTDERHSPHPVDNFIGSRVLSVAAGFYHTIVLTTNNASTTNAAGNSASSTATKNNTPIKNTTTALHTLHNDLIDESGLHPTKHANTASNMYDTLLKDAALLTGIKNTTTGSKNGIIVPFAMDRKSRVNSRELLLFLVNHVERLMIFPGAANSGSNSTENANAEETATNNSDDDNNRGTKQWVTKVLCCVTSMLEMCTAIVESAEDSANSPALPLSVDEALAFTMKLVKIVSMLLQQYSEVIVSAQNCVRTASNNSSKTTTVETMERIEESSELYYINDLLNSGASKTSTRAVNSAYILSIFDSCTSLQKDDATEASRSDSGNVEVHNAVCVLRRKLFSMYFAHTLRDPLLQSKYNTIVTDIALNFAHNHATLLSTPRLLSQLFLILKAYTLPLVTVSNVNVHTQTLCVRLLTILCATYRNSEEVIRIFQQDQVHALVVFRSMLSLYGHFSMHSLVKRFHTHRATPVAGVGVTSTATVTNTESADVKRLITVLEHGISNFVKCAVPIMFSSAASNYSDVSVSHNKTAADDASTRRHLVYEYGVLILQDVLSDAGRLIDNVLTQQTQSDETLGQLRYGTIMPSILPSILIYGISFCKHKCVMLEIVPDVNKLLKKLQLIGKSNSNHNHAFSSVNSSLTSAKNMTASPTDKKHPHDTLSGSIRNTMSQIGTSISHAIDTATHTQPLATAAAAAVNNSTSTMLVPYCPAQEEECEFDDATLNKTSQQWYYRLIKLCNMYIAKMAAALISAPTTSAFAASSGDASGSTNAFMLSDSQRMIAYHCLFRFVQFDTFSTQVDVSHPGALCDHISALLSQDIEENRASEHVIKMCNAYRDREKSTDAVYKMLSQSTQSMFSTNIFNLMEETLLDCVVALTGTSHIGITKTAQYFKLISRFTKRVHSKRSVLVGGGDNSWVEVLMCLCNVVKIFASVVVKSQLCVCHSVPLMLPFPNAKDLESSLSEARVLVRQRWRRAFMVILCVHRWQAACTVQYKQLPHYAVDFVTICTRIVTDDFTCIPAAGELCQRIVSVFESLQAATLEAADCAKGIHIAQTLLADVNSHTLRCDVLCVLTAALRERTLTMNAKLEQYAPVSPDGQSGVVKGTGSKNAEESLTHFCNSVALLSHPASLRALYAHLVTLVTSINLANNNITLQELSLLSHGVKLLQLSVQDTTHELSHIIQLLPLNTLKGMLLQLRERQKATSSTAEEASNSNSSSTSGSGSKLNPANKKHPASTIRDRNAAYRRVTADVLQYLQTIATHASESALHCRPSHCAQLVELHNFLISSYQLQRVESLKHDALCEEAARCSVDGAAVGSSGVLNPSTLSITASGHLSSNSTLITTNSASSNSNSSSTILINTSTQKNNKNRRCQDLITKPMEFCRNVEGFVVNSDKLLNSYKGVDFTMAFWIHIPKKCTKSSFITGKLNHSDAWPLLVLRPDHKLEIIYGHNNEFEKMTSSSSISQSWTHIAVIVEAKKIKLFLNGALDCSVTTAKGNSRAFLYPLLVGAAGTAYKTKNSIVKEGFDGILAQFKYHSRALQPIHVKIVYDSGPPENGDISNKLIYMLLSSLKCLLTPLHCAYVQPTLQHTASIMHLLFVTDGSRRTRFVALHILMDVLCMDCVTDVHLYSHVMLTADSPQSVLMSQCTFLDAAWSFKEKIIVYLLTLAGACWAPHILARLENACEKVHLSSSADHSVFSSDKNHQANVQLAELLRFAPHFASHDAHHLPMGASFSGLPPSQKKESRSEMCNQIVKALVRLSNVNGWKEAMGTVINRIASVVIGSKHTDNCTPSAPATTVLASLTYSTQLQTIALSLVLGGGTEGTYVGAYARNFFSDVAGVILNINKTTNFVTLLCHNTQHGHQQIVKVRLADIIITPRRDIVRLDIFPASVTHSVVGLLRSVCGFLPIVLSDYMCSSIPDSALHRVVLKSTRPMEVFVFAQLLYAITAIPSNSECGAVLRSITTDIALSPLLHTLQQASMATLTTTSNDAVHHLGDNRTPYCTSSLAQLFHNAHAFLLALPERTKQKVLFSNDEIKTLCECVSKHFNMSTDCILEPTQSNLMKQGRLGELVQLLSLENNELIPNLRDIVADFVQQTVQSTHSSCADSVAKHESTDTVISNLVSEWPPSFVSEYPSVCSDSTRNDVHCVAMMALLLHLRTDVVHNARTLLNTVNATAAGSVNEKNWTREVVVWQSLPHVSDSHVMSAIHNTVHDIVNTPVSSWDSKCAYLYTHKRMETTQMLALSLRYFALSLLQLNVFKSADNMYECVDLFGRTLNTVVSWVDYGARSTAATLKNGESSDGNSNGAEVSVTLLKLLLPTLSFIDNGTVALQLTQLCTLLVRKLAVQFYHHYIPSKELIDLAKSNNFTLLRARAQEQVIKYKTHKMGNVSPLAYNLTQLVSNLELVQRLCSNHTTLEKADSSKTLQVLLQKMQTVETAPPKVTGIRAASVDADLTLCAEAALAQLLSLHSANDTHEAAESLDLSAFAKLDHVMVEVALGTNGGSRLPGAPVNVSDIYFETVYCGASMRFVQSGLVPECTYYLRSRVYVHNTPLMWSAPVEFKTAKGVLFTFDCMKCGPDIRLRDDGLSAVYGNDDAWSSVLGTRAFTNGVTHWDIRINSSSTAYVFVGVASSSADLSSFLGGCANGWGFIGEQALYHNREKVKVYGESFVAGDIVGVTLDLNNGTMSFQRNHKSLGVAFDHIFGELYPAVAFYNVGQEIEILTDGFSTTCSFESIPTSPCRLNFDEISTLNELALSLYTRQPLSHRLCVLVAEQCNVWCAANHTRARAVSGRDVYLNTQSALLTQYNLIAGERVRTPYGVAEVAGTAYNKVWFVVNAAGEVWYFTIQQIVEGRAKKMFLRCSYEHAAISDGANAHTNEAGHGNHNVTAEISQMTYDHQSIVEHIDPSKWSPEMDALLLTFLQKQCDTQGASSIYSVTSQCVTDNFRSLQQQFSRIMMENAYLSHRWGISGPKRRAVLARIGLIRMLNQYLGMYLPFVISDHSSKVFVQNQTTLTDDFAPVVVSLKAGNAIGVPTTTTNLANKNNTFDSYTHITNPLSTSTTTLWSPPENHIYPLIHLSYYSAAAQLHLVSTELARGPVHALRSLVFSPLKMAHFHEIIKKSTTRAAKTEDDYDYPDDLPHVKINRLKSFRAREASELLLIPGEDLMLSSMFCQLYRELRQYNDEKLRISYTHPMDDGQSRTFKIKFEGEGVDDYGGPYREIFQQICEEIQSTDPSAMTGSSRPSSWAVGEDKQVPQSQSQSSTYNGTAPLAASASAQIPSANAPESAATIDTASPARCFLPLLMPTPNWTADGDCAERYRYMFHPAAESPLKMDLYHFLGQLVGIAVRSKITLDLALPSYIWKYVVCEKLTEEDIASFDAPAFTALHRLGAAHQQYCELDAQHQRGEHIDPTAQAMLQYNLLELIDDLTWCYTRSDGVVCELIPGQGQTRVELVDVQKYLILYAEARLTESRHAIGMFRRGLVSILPESALSLLKWDELQAAVCGPRVIDIARLRENTEYDDDLSAEDPHITLFWEVLETFSEAQKSSFLRFVWARPTLPPRGVEFTQKMRVLSAVGEEAHQNPDMYLPKAHTCFFSLNLPKYTTKEIMAEKLLYAITNCTEMDADFRTTEVDVVGWGAAAGVPGAGNEF